MNIRSAIEEVLYYAGDATLLPCVPVQLEHALSTLRAWLDAQPEATERWEPVADINRMSGTFIRPDDTSTPLRGLSILSEDGRICIDWRDGGVEVDLPADLRLCRRVEVQP